MKKEVLKKINEGINGKGIVISFEKLIPFKGTVVTVSTMVVGKALDSPH